MTGVERSQSQTDRRQDAFDKQSSSFYMKPVKRVKNVIELLDELIDAHTDTSVVRAQHSHCFRMLMRSENNFWLKESNLPQDLQDAQLFPIDGDAFVVLHAVENNPSEDNRAMTEKRLNSYICYPFRDEYIQLKLIHDNFPQYIFDCDGYNHEKIFDVTDHADNSYNKNKNHRHFISIGDNWNSEDSSNETKHGNFIYKIIVNLTQCTIEYVNLLTVANTPIHHDNDLGIIDTLHGQHAHRINDHIYMITGGCMDWSNSTDIFLFDAQTYEYRKYKDIIPYGDDMSGTEGLVARNENEFVLWSQRKCLLMKCKGLQTIVNIKQDLVEFSFEKIAFIELQPGYMELVRVCSGYVRYKDYILCVGGLRDEGDDGVWRQLDTIFVFNLSLLQWSAFEHVKLPSASSDHSCMISINQYNGDVILNIVGGERWEIDDDNHRIDDYAVSNHRKLYLGIDDAFRMKILNIMQTNDILPQSVWRLVFDMIDDGLFRSRMEQKSFL